METVQTKHSVHDAVTDQIIELLEQGIVAGILHGLMEEYRQTY